MSTAKYFLILNITPDSFSDGTDHLPDADYRDSKWLVKKANELINNGADALDIGAESTRPGAERVDVTEEYNRLENFLKHFCKEQ